MLRIFAVPDLRTSYVKLVRALENQSPDTLLLNQQTNLEYHLSETALGRLTYEEFVNKVREENIAPEPIESWIYHTEPLLKALPRLKVRNPDMEIRCYVDPSYHKSVVDVASRITCLTLRSIVRGRVDAEEWRNVIEGWLRERSDEAEREADVVYRAAGDSAVCVADYDGSWLEVPLKRRGSEVFRSVIEDLYHPRPIEALQMLLEGATGISKDEVEAIAKEHIKYVREYVMRSKTRDRAYWRWAFDNFPEIRARYGLDEIEILDHIIFD